MLVPGKFHLCISAQCMLNGNSFPSIWVGDPRTVFYREPARLLHRMCTALAMPPEPDNRDQELGAMVQLPDTEEF